MMDDFDLENENVEVEEQPAATSNRTFLLVAGILGAVLILTLIFIAVYAMVFLPRNREAQSTEVAEINAQNTEVAMLSALTAQARSWTSTPTSTLVPTEMPDTPTPVLAPTDTPESELSGLEATADPRTATVAALLTQQAGNTTPAATELPDTGIMDNLGIPGLVALAGSLVLVIILARRLRSVS
jgi:hypothetical protein